MKKCFEFPLALFLFLHCSCLFIANRIFHFTPNQALAYLASQAIFDIFLPFFKPNVLLVGYSRESAESLTKIISPIFRIGDAEPVSS
jgi:hypothetical protein